MRIYLPLHSFGVPGEGVVRVLPKGLPGQGDVLGEENWCGTSDPLSVKDHRLQVPGPDDDRGRVVPHEDG